MLTGTEPKFTDIGLIVSLDSALARWVKVPNISGPKIRENRMRGDLSVRFIKISWIAAMNPAGGGNRVGGFHLVLQSQIKQGIAAELLVCGTVLVQVRDTERYRVAAGLTGPAGLNLVGGDYGEYEKLPLGDVKAKVSGDREALGTAARGNAFHSAHANQRKKCFLSN